MTAAPAAMAVPAETAAWAAPGVLAGRLDYWGMSAGPAPAAMAVPAETAAWAAPGVLAGRLDYWGMSAGPRSMAFKPLIKMSDRLR